MQNKILLTPVDMLVEHIEKNPNISINSLKNFLKEPKELIEKWLVVLEEYKVLEVHYKGLEGFVNLNKEDVKEKQEKKETLIDINNLKKEFLKKAKLRNLSEEHLKELWPKFIKTYEVEIKDIFYNSAKKKGHNNKMTNLAWEKYKGELIKF